MQNHFETLKSSLFTTSIIKTPLKPIITHNQPQKTMVTPIMSYNGSKSTIRISVNNPNLDSKVSSIMMSANSNSTTATKISDKKLGSNAPNIQKNIQDGLFSSKGVNPYGYNSKIQASKVQNTPTKQTPFLVEGSYLAKEMWCKEDYQTGDIQCSLDYNEDEESAAEPIAEFNIEEITSDYQNISTYYEDIWDEKKIHKFEEPDPNEKDDIGPLTGIIAVAIEDYDKMIFASKLVSGDDGTRCVQVNLKDNSKSKVLKEDYVCLVDYDQFNLELFYEFCRRNPQDGKDQASLYPFINLENVDQKELDQFVIGTWINNHLNREEMKAELQKKGY